MRSSSSVSRTGGMGTSSPRALPESATPSPATSSSPITRWRSAGPTSRRTRETWERISSGREAGRPGSREPPCRNGRRGCGRRHRRRARCSAPWRRSTASPASRAPTLRGSRTAAIRRGGRSRPTATERTGSTTVESIGKGRSFSPRSPRACGRRRRPPDTTCSPIFPPRSRSIRATSSACRPQSMRSPRSASIRNRSRSGPITGGSTGA